MSETDIGEIKIIARKTSATKCDTKRTYTMDQTEQYINRKFAWFEDIYNGVELLRLKMWDKIDTSKEELKELALEFNGDVSLVDKLSNNAVATYDNGILKVVVNDILPRECFTRVKAAAKLLRYSWIGNITSAIYRLKDAGESIDYDKGHCFIINYLPRDPDWDVDNRAFKYIIDSLRYSQVIKGDTAKHLSLTIIGSVDKIHPRTEIYVVEFQWLMEKLGDILPNINMAK